MYQPPRNALLYALLLTLLFRSAVAAQSLPESVQQALIRAQQGIDAQNSRLFELDYHRFNSSDEELQWRLRSRPDQDPRWELLSSRGQQPSANEIQEADKRWNGSSDEQNVEISIDFERSQLLAATATHWPIALHLNYSRNGKTYRRLEEAIEAVAWYNPNTSQIDRIKGRTVEPFNVYLLSVQHLLLDMHLEEHQQQIRVQRSEQSVEARLLFWRWDQSSSYQYHYQ